MTWKHFSTSDLVNNSTDRDSLTRRLALSLAHLCMLLRDFNGWDVDIKVMKVLNIHRTVNLNSSPLRKYYFNSAAYPGSTWTVLDEYGGCTFNSTQKEDLSGKLLFATKSFINVSGFQAFSILRILRRFCWVMKKLWNCIKPIYYSEKQAELNEQPLYDVVRWTKKSSECGKVTTRNLHLCSRPKSPRSLVVTFRNRTGITCYVIKSPQSIRKFVALTLSLTLPRKMEGKLLFREKASERERGK